jgi:hypothetical protein
MVFDDRAEAAAVREVRSMSTVLDTPAGRVATFAAMSATLTGFTLDTLAPAIDPDQLCAHLLQQVDARMQKSPGAVDQLLAQFTTLRAQALTPQQIADSLLGISPVSGPTTQFAPLARSIVKLWYLGSWYDLSSQLWFDGDTVSSLAYRSGLIWPALQTHPMGDSPYKFGYWTSTPPPLAAFGADVPGKQS